uniref:Strongylocin 2 n=1 Tax=Echinus esculentus TaxID=7648 RepID=STCN2_ECHES|nr:RecName: Full=Strongylocin 2; AltName: Full=EeStrongylocin 2; Flags: Precursor [Echinus esculentus]AMT92376.1 strongylocin 2 [Echinus esculentus]
MNIRTASFTFIVVMMILSQTMADRFFNEPEEDDHLVESWNPFKKIAHRHCYPKNECITTNGKKTCKDYSCCQIVLFGKKTRSACTVVAQ